MSEEKDIERQLATGNEPMENDETNSSTEPVPETEQPQTENMETHADHLHKAPGHGWRHYVFEFLMLFLAVFCGFLAEYQLEHVIEHQREKQYAQSLYDDLKIDTSILQRTYDEKGWIQAKFDSAKNILAANDLDNNNEFIYYIERYLTVNDVFTSQDVTYKQLSSSGNFRYFKNIALYKKIADYYNLYLRYQSMDGTFGFADKNGLSELEAKLFNPADLTSLDNKNANTFYDVYLRPVRKFEKINQDPYLLKLFFIKVANAEAKAAGAQSFFIWLKEKAVEIMNDLRKEYHLEQ